MKRVALTEKPHVWASFLERQFLLDLPKWWMKRVALSEKPHVWASLPAAMAPYFLVRSPRKKIK